MNSGFLTFATKGRAFRSVGTHQRFDREGYRLISPFVDHSHFPRRKDILVFEGVGGPDGLKFKGNYNTSHMYDPVNEIGHLPVWIESHLGSMTQALQVGDMVEASFHAGWMAHYLTDSLTPAHHLSHDLIAAEYDEKSKARQNWLYWGRKGLMSSHVAFEAGIATTMFMSPIRASFDEALYKRIKKQGLANCVKEESYKIAKLGIYDRYLKKGWSNKLAREIKLSVVPRIPQLIAAAWLLAYEQAGYNVAAPLTSVARSPRSIG